MVVTGVGPVASDLAASWLAWATSADLASVALLRLKPSGYPKMRFPGSPGNWNGGCTGLRVMFLLPQLPTQKDETSDMSIQAPSNATFLCHVTISLIHHWPAPSLNQSGKTVYPGHTAPIYRLPSGLVMNELVAFPLSNVEYLVEMSVFDWWRHNTSGTYASLAFSGFGT